MLDNVRWNTKVISIGKYIRVENSIIEKDINLTSSEKREAIEWTVNLQDRKYYLFERQFA